MKKVHFVLYFAHRGEAQSFLKELPFQAKNHNHYVYEDHQAIRTLLIGGEGVDNTILNLTKALSEKSSSQDNCESILGLGVCGHIPRPGESFEVGTPVQIKTCMRENSHGDLFFKTFTCTPSNLNLPSLDIVTTEQRVLKESDHHKISPFAPLIDREAWALGFVAHSYQIPFVSLKVISDLAQGEICQTVKEDAPIWSDTLLREYQNWENHKLSKNAKDTEAPQSFKEQLPELYLTLSQERSLNNLLKALTLKGYQLPEIKNNINYHEIVTLKIHAKKKAKIFLKRIKDLLNPLEAQLKDQLEKQTHHLSQAGFTIRYAQGFEKDLLHLNITIESEEDIKRAAKALEQYSFKRYQEILNGDSLV